MRKYLTLFLLGISFNVPCATLDAHELHIATFDIAPFSYYEKGELKGYNIDILNQLEKLTKFKFIYEVLPYGRVKLSVGRAGPDLLIMLRNTCLKNSDNYEVQEKLFELTPSIFVKKSATHLSNDMRVGRLISTCELLAKKYLKKENVIDLTSMDQAIDMLEGEKLDGICALVPIMNYNLKKRKFSEQMIIYKSQVNDDHLFDAVLCSKRTLSAEIKKQLKTAVRQVKIPKML